MKVGADPSYVARASCPRLMDFGLYLSFSCDVKTSLLRERDAPATAGETPALRRLWAAVLTFMSGNAWWRDPLAPRNHLIKWLIAFVEES